ncbi:TatD family hydrolase [Fluviispira sanaruensis]|uniref:TatD family deoxyribonuclease n=1 Tax=Fluviispira sanaruensis TaxID=2493639 RepID=A0A4P2VHW1_FLUSA|nr:TatD family hydrolase [Fluviispira sanaruensis]BBH52613.1 TatD family deoxyribonuclease [Fluviispira sanaruensis]
MSSDFGNAQRYFCSGGRSIFTWENFYKINNPYLIDAHFHLNYLKDIPRSIEQALKSSVKSGVVAGVWNNDTLEHLALKDNKSLENIKFLKKDLQQLNSIKDDEFICFLAHGLHPMSVHEKWLNADGSCHNESIQSDIQQFKDILYKNLNYIWAIGETGFDLSKDILQSEKCKNLSKQDIIFLQNIAFEVCVQAAIQYNLPLILHLRGSWSLCINKIKWAKNKGVKKIMVHCFSGPAEDMKTLARLSIYCSFGGVPTWEKAVKNRNAFLQCDPNFLMLETDSPDLPPELPDQAKLENNEPKYLKNIAEILAKYANTDLDYFIKNSNKNILNFLGVFGR